MKRTIALILSLLMLATMFSACDINIGNKTAGGDNNGQSDNIGNGGNSNSSSDNIPRGELSLYPAYVQMPLDFIVYIDVETGQEVEWSSSDPLVATVGPDGMISGVAEGEAVITATVKGKPSVAASCGVRITEAVYGEDDEDTGSILIWEDEAPEPTDWDALEAEAGITPTMTQTNNLEAEFLPAVYTGSNPGSVISLAAGNGKPKSPPIELKAQKGKKEVRPKRKETKQLLEKGFVWTIWVTDRQNEDFFGYDNDEYGLSFNLSGKSIKVGEEEIYGYFEGYALFHLYVDCSKWIPKHLPNGGPKKVTWKYEGIINDFNFGFTRSELVDIVYISEGSFEWSYHKTHVETHKDGYLVDISYTGENTLSYKLYISPATYVLTLIMEKPFDFSWNDDDPTIRYSGYVAMSPIKLK